MEYLINDEARAASVSLAIGYLRGTLGKLEEMTGAAIKARSADSIPVGIVEDALDVAVSMIDADLREMELAMLDFTRARARMPERSK